MKLFDRYKLSLHNIKNNKSRSILTTIIVYVISLLIITILCVGISFSTNMTKIVKEYYRVTEEPIKVEYYNYYGNEQLDKELYELVDPILSNHKDIISYTKYNYKTNDYDVMIQNHDFSSSNYIEIIEGENVNAEDKNTNKVLISSKFVNEYYKKNSKVLKPGDIFEYDFKYYIEEKVEYSDYMRTQINKEKRITLEIKGIYKVTETSDKNDSYNYYDSFISNNVNLIADAQYIIENIPDLYYDSCYYYYNMPKSNFNNEEITNKLDSFVSDLSSVLPKERENRDSVNCYELEELKMTKIIGLVIIGLAAFLCLVLILLSIGSLANTIMISVDKNKKFIGLLKALGLDEKDLKSTIKMESITTIFLGILLSFSTVYVFKNVLGKLNELLISSLFSQYLSSITYNVIFIVPLYVPLIVMVFFVFFTLLFARSSMSKIAKTDPMAVISEVA